MDSFANHAQLIESIFQCGTKQKNTIEYILYGEIFGYLPEYSVHFHR